MRLTYKAQDQHGKETGTVWYASTAGCIFPKSDKEEQALKKLAAYEDTGLSPEDFRERIESVLELYGKLKPYADAEEEGRLVILPCKVGDTVYKVWYAPCKFGEDHPDSIGCEGCPGPCDIKKTIYEMKALTKAWIVQTFCGPGRSLVYFLTREEAEAALKGGQDDA